jgi:hypothetical protein
MGRTVTPPREIAAALRALFGDGVEHVRIIEHSRFARLHVCAVATTRRRCIYLRGSAEDFFADPVLMLHEYCHVLKQWEPGTLTRLRYILEWLKHGYWENRFEVEARAFAREHLHRFRALLQAQASAEQRLSVVEPSRQKGQSAACQYGDTH